MTDLFSCKGQRALGRTARVEADVVNCILCSQEFEEIRVDYAINNI